MPIIDLQTRARELGRIRIGQVVPTKTGKTRPAKLDRFRITAYSKDLIEKIAALYGGEVQEWTPQGKGAPGWEVVTTSTRLPVLVPPQPVSQWYETWSGGGCQRRCDGVHEVLSDSPCLCGPDPAQRMCKPTTRLNVVLREVEGVGVFRLETKGYYAAVELPSAAELLAASRGYISGYLSLEERVVTRDGETRRFMVPTIDVEVTPMQLMAGAGSVQAISRQQDAAAIAAPEPRALPSAPEPARLDPDSVRAAIAAVTSLDGLRALWHDAKTAGLEDLVKARAEQLKPKPKPEPLPGDDDLPPQQALQQLQTQGEQITALDPDEMWSKIMRTVPGTWDTDQVETEFANYTGVPAEQASAVDMARFLDHLAQVKP